MFWDVMVIMKSGRVMLMMVLGVKVGIIIIGWLMIEILLKLVGLLDYIVSVKVMIIVSGIV